MFVKVCGITSEEDALLAVAVGADAIGFEFGPTARQVAPRVVAEIVKRLPPEIHTVGVFRDQDAKRVAHVVTMCGLAAAQLDGNESPEMTRSIAALVPAVIKTFSVDSQELPHANLWGTKAVLVQVDPGAGSAMGNPYAARRAPHEQYVILSGVSDLQRFQAAADASLAQGFNLTTCVEARPGHVSPVLLAQSVVAAKAVRSSPRPRPDTPFNWEEVPLYARPNTRQYTPVRKQVSILSRLGHA